MCVVTYNYIIFRSLFQWGDTDHCFHSLQQLQYNISGMQILAWTVQAMLCRK